jgi:hypothetical protein
MQPKVNRQLFTQRVFDSGSLGVLASVIHQFERPGRYEMTVFHAGSPSGNISFIVDPESATRQLSIDLAGVERQTRDAGDCCDSKSEPLVVSPQGYVLFYATRGTDFSVRVRIGEEKNPVFDSEKLGKGDLFALSLMEPTKYSVIDRIGGARGQITVGFSAAHAKRLKSLGPVYVEAKGKAIDPATINLVSTQGLVFRIHQRSRIVVEKLGEPRKEASPKFQWRPAPTIESKKPDRPKPASKKRKTK